VGEPVPALLSFEVHFPFPSTAILNTFPNLSDPSSSSAIYSAQITKKSCGGGGPAHTWGSGGSSALLRNHQPAHPFIQDPAMPPLPPPNTLAQLEEACRRLEEVSTKPSKQRWVSASRRSP